MGSALSFSAFIFYKWQLPEFNGIKAAPSQLYTTPLCRPFGPQCNEKHFACHLIALTYINKGLFEIMLISL
jgi:hypothetical protein